MLARSPGITATAALSLALGIGGNATVFGWAQGVLLHPLPGLKNDNQLAAVETIMPDGSYHTSSYPDNTDYCDHNQVFSGLIGFELIGDNMSVDDSKEVERLDPSVPILESENLSNLVRASLFAERTAATLAAVLGLLLATTGIYGVMSCMVRQRANEIRIRMALGAQPGQIPAMIVRQAMALTLIGLSLGVAGALVLTRYLSSLLFGVSATDPATFVGMGLVLSTVALVACYVPARRATQVDPLAALRYE